MEKQIAEYNIGKRHLAKIVGEDPDNFTEADINVNYTFFIIIIKMFLINYRYY